MSRKSRSSLSEKTLSPEEQQAKINDVRRMLGPNAQKVPVLCTDASILRYLRARNWNTKKASKMLEESSKWRLRYKPEKIRWEDIAREAETGKVYRANYCDKFGRPVLIMRPGFQNTSSTEGQIKYLVYCMENAIMNLNPGREQMMWLIDFHRWTMSSISVKVTRETANILQNHYPERLALAILYNPPKIFESFWTMVKPFIEPKTYKKVRFAYPNDPQSQRIMEALFDMDNLESEFGGRNTVGFDYEAYAQRMREDDNKKFNVINSGCSSPITQPSVASQSEDNKKSNTIDSECPSPITQLSIDSQLEDNEKSNTINSGCSSPITQPSIASQSQQLESLTSDLSSEVSEEEELSSVEETAANLENVDKKVQGLTLSYEDVPKSEAAVQKDLQREKIHLCTEGSYER